MEKIADPMISEEGNIYSLAGLRRLLAELTAAEPSAAEDTEEGERLCG